MIIDTSIWIEYFKNKPDIVKIIESGLNEESIYITGPIVSELLHGVKSEKEFEMLSKYIDAVPYLECELKDWIHAGKISFSLRKKGITVPLTDIIISAISINKGAKIFTLDKHFEQIPGIELFTGFQAAL